MGFIDAGWVLLLCLTGFMIYLQAHTFTKREKLKAERVQESLELLTVKTATAADDVKKRLDRLERAEALLNFIVKDYREAQEKDENNKHLRKIVRINNDTND
jgi:translation initiation factor IF-2